MTFYMCCKIVNNFVIKTYVYIVYVYSRRNNVSQFYITFLNMHPFRFVPHVMTSQVSFFWARKYVWWQAHQHLVHGQPILMDSCQTQNKHKTSIIQNSLKSCILAPKLKRIYFSSLKLSSISRNAIKAITIKNTVDYSLGMI